VPTTLMCCLTAVHVPPGGAYHFGFCPDFFSPIRILNTQINDTSMGFDIILMFQHHKKFMLAQFIINFLKHIKNYKQVSHLFIPNPNMNHNPQLNHKSYQFPIKLNSMDLITSNFHPL